MIIFENRVLRGKCRLKRDEVAGGKINNEFNNIHTLPRILRIIKSRKILHAGHADDVSKNEFRIHTFTLSTSMKDLNVK